MPIRECIESHTHREYKAWMRWLNEEYSNPSRSDYYLMAIAAEVRRVLHTKPRSVRLNDFVLDFRDPKPKKEAPKLSLEQRTAVAKAGWLSRMTKPVKIVEA